MKDTLLLLASLALLSSMGCGGGKDDDEDSSLRWQCYEIGFDDSCECYGIEPGYTMEYEGSEITEVDACEGYEVCMSYFDEFFEEERCDCGGAGFMPFGDPEDLSDITMVEACPEE